MTDLTKNLKTKPEKGFSRRQKLFLMVLLGINVCIFGGMWLLSASPAPADHAQTLTAGAGLALRDAYKQALAAALGWQPDVQVVGANTSWRLANGDALSLGRPAWSFSFHSAAAGHVQLVTIDQQSARFGPQQPAGAVPQPVAPDWDLDSEELLLTFLSYGGKAFLSAHPGANIHMQLKADEAGRSIWSITAIDPIQRESLLVRVDARTRQVVQADDSEGGV
jgi:hypothetical protein